MREVVFDIEAAGLRPWARLWCLSWWETGKGITTIFDGIYERLLGWLASPEVTIVGHNIVAYDIPVVFYNKPFPKVEAKIVDTHLLSKVLYPFRRRHGLDFWGDDLAKEGLAPKKVQVADEMWETGNLPLMKERCETDVEISLALYRKMKNQRLGWYDLELDFIPYIMEMLSTGIPIRMGAAIEAETYLRKQIKKRSTVDNPLKNKANLGSKLAWGAYCKERNIELPRTEKGNISINKDNRPLVVGLCPELDLHYEHKKDNQILSYISFDPKIVNDDKKTSNLWAKVSLDTDMQPRLYSNLSYYGTRTLRGAYSNPCVNSFPKGKLREMVGFNDTSDYQLLGIDIDQLELAWLGYYLKELCNDDTVWREKEEGLSPKKLTLDAYGSLFAHYTNIKEREAVAKTVNYATIYGQQPKATCITLLLEPTFENIALVEVARERRFPKLQRLTEMLESKMSYSGYMLNAYKQPVRAVKLKGVDEYATALNTAMQSSGNAYAKRLFYHILKALKERLPFVQPLLWNHDEMQMAVLKGTSKESVQEALDKAYIAFASEKYADVPLITKANFDLGVTWDETH